MITKLKLKKLPRLFGMMVITAVLTATIAILVPANLSVTLYKLSLVTLAAVVGYWIDRALFPYARPHEVLDREQASIRRAIIVGATIIGTTLGL